MRMLDRKLLRDTWRLRGQMLSIAAIVAAGILSVITLQGTLRSLELAREDYYREYRFADVFATLDRAPEGVARRLEAVPGVAAVETRITSLVVLQVPGLDLPATGRIVSIPATGQPGLNRLHIRQGRWIAPAAHDEILLSEQFARANGLSAGDTLRAVVNGRLRTLHIAGIALSPEFVYEVDPASGFLSDERLFGVLWLGREALEAAEDMAGAFNDVAVRLAPGASERRVLAGIDGVLDAYGGLGSHGRRDQISARLLDDEIAQNRATAAVIPFVFLSIAAFLLNIVLLRLTSLERDQIGTLKAFGYEDTDIGLHYLRLAGTAVALGTVFGIGAGMWLGSAYTDLYARYFRFPVLEYRPGWAPAATAIVVSAAAALAGAWSAVRRAARLQPAEAMRAEAPAEFRPLMVERWGLHHLLSPAQRMVLRNVERRPARAVVSALGVAFSIAILLIGMVLLDSVYGMVDIQFRTIQREDAFTSFTRPADPRAVRELLRVPGIVEAEAYRMVPVRLTSGHRTRLVAVTGLEHGSRLRPMTDGEGRTYPLPAGGIVLSRRLALNLGVAPGDALRMELMDRGGAVRHTTVAALVDEMIGVNAYMEAAELGRLLGELPQVSGAWLRIRRGEEASVYAALRERPAVAGTVSKSAMVRAFEDQMADSLAITMTILVTLASILAVGVIYNGARIALSERGRELASLRVLGFTRAEVAAMLLGEQGIITLLGLPVGAVLGAVMSAVIIRAYDTEMYRMPLVLRPTTFVTAAALIVVVAAVAGLLVRRRLDRADLIAVLKTRE
jgi:putative ABC transport system permease protein